MTMKLMTIAKLSSLVNYENHALGTRFSLVVKALGHKPEGRGFDIR
jgi:hypothetical protein